MLVFYCFFFLLLIENSATYLIILSIYDMFKRSGLVWRTLPVTVLRGILL